MLGGIPRRRRVRRVPVVRIHDKVALSVAVICFSASMLDVFANHEAERSRDRAECRVDAEARRSAVFLSGATEVRGRDPNHCAEPSMRVHP